MSTNSMCPLYIHFSSLPLLGYLTLVLEGSWDLLVGNTEGLLFVDFGRSASLLLRLRIIGGRAGGLELRPNFSAMNSPLLTLSAFDNQRRQSEKRRNSLSLGDEASTCRSGPRLSKLRPGEMSWNGRFGVLRWMARRERVCA